jgi:hypothetical protein
MLVIRTWRQGGPDGDLEARIRHTLDVTAQETRTVIAHGSGEVRDEVLSWLEDLLGAAR